PRAQDRPHCYRFQSARMQKLLPARGLCSNVTGIRVGATLWLLAWAAFGCDEIIKTARPAEIQLRTAEWPQCKPRRKHHMCRSIGIFGAWVSACFSLALTTAPSIAWEPTKPVEIVVAAGAGGASDQMARMMQLAIQKNGLMKQPLVVSLKGGASGAEALIYMKGSEGDPHKVLIAYSLIYMLPLSAKIPFNWRDLTPVAVVALDQFVLWDNATLPYKTVKEFIEAAKAANPPFKMGGTGSKREDHVLTVFIEKKTGA